MNGFNVSVELQVKLDEVEQMALKGGKKELHKLEGRVSADNSVCVCMCVHALHSWNPDFNMSPKMLVCRLKFEYKGL